MIARSQDARLSFVRSYAREFLLRLKWGKRRHFLNKKIVEKSETTAFFYPLSFFLSRKRIKNIQSSERTEREHVCLAKQETKIVFEEIHISRSLVVVAHDDDGDDRREREREREKKSKTVRSIFVPFRVRKNKNFRIVFFFFFFAFKTHHTRCVRTTTTTTQTEERKKERERETFCSFSRK